MHRKATLSHNSRSGLGGPRRLTRRETTQRALITKVEVVKVRQVLCYNKYCTYERFNKESVAGSAAARWLIVRTFRLRMPLRAWRVGP